jgi:hypothetical protein
MVQLPPSGYEKGTNQETYAPSHMNNVTGTWERRSPFTANREKGESFHKIAE